MCPSVSRSFAPSEYAVWTVISRIRTFRCFQGSEHGINSASMSSWCRLIKFTSCEHVQGLIDLASLFSRPSGTPKPCGTGLLHRPTQAPSPISCRRKLDSAFNHDRTRQHNNVVQLGRSIVRELGERAAAGFKLAAIDSLYVRSHASGRVCKNRPCRTRTHKL
jgi:hypothetical protein